jgi:hypothetical protein
MTSFLLDPKEESAIMYNAVSKFGLMTKTPADEPTIRQIVAYLQDQQPEEPSWFRSHRENESMPKQ